MEGCREAARLLSSSLALVGGRLLHAHRHAANVTTGSAAIHRQPYGLATQDGPTAREGIRVGRYWHRNSAKREFIPRDVHSFARGARRWPTNFIQICCRQPIRRSRSIPTQLSTPRGRSIQLSNES